MTGIIESISTGGEFVSFEEPRIVYDEKFFVLAGLAIVGVVGFWLWGSGYNPWKEIRKLIRQFKGRRRK